MAWRDSRARWPIVLLVLVFFLATTLTRQWAATQRGERNLTAATPLSRMNSYALALLLGGLRGPLVMFLWPSSEGQKTEKNLEDFDTKVEWIRLLQAEFDTVHIFQIWNKAYNISVLMANLPNKYATILDALDYARNVDRERPGNVNILVAIAGLYGEKLGNSNPEKTYYKQRIREETMPREPLWRVTFPESRRREFTDAAIRAGAVASRLDFARNPEAGTLSVTLRQSIADAVRANFAGDGITWQERRRQNLNPNAPGFRRTALDPMLDPQGNILSELVEPRQNLANPGGNDGSELQYLKEFQPYPYGLSAHALAYNYYKRAQALLRGSNQHHAQLSDLVVDSRPALTLRNWSEDEWERGRYAELEAFGLPVSDLAREERWRLEAPSSTVTFDARVVNPAALKEAIFDYNLGARVAQEAIEEYEAHLKDYSTNFITYRAHMDDLRGRISLLRGDEDFLKVFPASAAERDQLRRSALEQYQDAIRRFQLVLLNYYLEPAQLQQFPPGVTRENIADKLTPAEYSQLFQRIRAQVQQLGMEGFSHFEDWSEYLSYIERAERRIKTLESAA